MCLPARRSGHVPSDFSRRVRTARGGVAWSFPCSCSNRRWNDANHSAEHNKPSSTRSLGLPTLRTTNTDRRDGISGWIADESRAVRDECRAAAALGGTPATWSASRISASVACDIARSAPGRPLVKYLRNTVHGRAHCHRAARYSTIQSTVQGGGSGGRAAQPGTYSNRARQATRNTRGEAPELPRAHRAAENSNASWLPDRALSAASAASCAMRADSMRPTLCREDALLPLESSVAMALHSTAT